ncbi:MAG: hypothetical protein IKJ44_00070, partial [Elusimicrobiaceae bacterium]|nr:hypothetical protein [Elusimicrobiaceae bacterium]
MFKVQSRFSANAESGGSDDWGTHVKADSATLGEHYAGEETAPKSRFVAVYYFLGYNYTAILKGDLNIPVKVSELEQDIAYLTHVPQEYITQQELDQKNYAAAQDVAEMAAKIPAEANAQNLLADKNFVLAEVAKNAAPQMPSGIFTQDNLAGGTDIEFVKEVVGGGQIDNDTILMLNLDGNAEDSSFYKGELSFGDASGWTYGEGKFGQMALSGSIIWINDPTNTLFNAVDKVTVDYTTFFSANASDTAIVRVTTTDNGADVYVYAYYYNGKILEAHINGSTTSIDTTNIDLEQYLQISYEISEGKVVIFINGNPVLTKEDSNIKMGTGLSAIGIQAPSSGNAGLDEVRVSKCLRYNGQPFEIPTQPYGPATETGRTLVKYVGDKPKGVYTEENLIGGKGVEIVKETASEGIDENTLACWHFDTDNKDVVNNLNYGSGQQHNTQYKKFGEASIRTTYAFENGLLSDTSSDWTIEGFFHRTSAGATAWVILGKGTYFTGSDVDGACFMLKTSGNVATLKNAKDDAVISTSIDTNSFEEWEHVAFQRKGGLLQGFHKGKKILEKA